MGVRRYFSREGRIRHFAYPFQVANDAMQMDVHKTLYPFYTTKKRPHVTVTITKMCFVGSNATFSLILLFTQYKTTSFTAISPHCLAALPATRGIVGRERVGRTAFQRLFPVLL